MMPPECDKTIQEAVAVLRRGGVVAFPTETVYGLGADATNAAAVRRVFEVKGRPGTNPLIVHVADEAVARRCVRQWPLAATGLVAAFWPGPLTIVVPKSDAIVPEVTAGLPTVGLRAPDHPLALELLRAFGGPVAAPSANRASRVSPTTAEHVRQDLGERVDMILDGGPCRVGIESTVLDLTGDQPRILRPGAIGREQIERVLGGPVQIGTRIADAMLPAMSPGQQERHYAPATPAYRFETSQRGLVPADNTGILAVGTQPTLSEWGRICAMPNEPQEYGRYFYRILRDLDQMNLRAIFIEMPPDEPRWAAIRDRIFRATEPLSIEQ